MARAIGEEPVVAVAAAREEGSASVDRRRTLWVRAWCVIHNELMLLFKRPQDAEDVSYDTGNGNGSFVAIAWSQLRSIEMRTLEPRAPGGSPCGGVPGSRTTSSPPPTSPAPGSPPGGPPNSAPGSPLLTPKMSGEAAETASSVSASSSPSSCRGSAFDLRMKDGTTVRLRTHSAEANNEWVAALLRVLSLSAVRTLRRTMSANSDDDWELVQVEQTTSDARTG